MTEERSYGIVPVYEDETGREYLLVQHHAGHWAFPKGHAESGESPRRAAERELCEETGLSRCDVLAEPAFQEHYTIHRSGKPVEKTVTYFIGRVHSRGITPQPEEIADTAWGNVDQTRQRITFPEGRALLDRVEAHLNGQAPTD